MSEKIVDIQTLVQDDHNFNKGTEAGRQLMERSFSELGAGRSILVDKDGRIIAGNKSQKAAIAAGIKKVRIIETTGDELVAVKRTDISLDSKEGRELALADNLTTQVNLEWDKVELQEVAAQQGIDLPDWGLDPAELQMDEDEEQAAPEKKEYKQLKDDFIFPPMSVLDTRIGIWQQRRAYWMEKTKIQSEIGREKNLNFSVTSQGASFYELKNELREKFGREPSTEELVAETKRRGTYMFEGTSIFDPVLCELMYRWYNIKGGRILDPFAGGSVRGVMAGQLGMEYHGNDLRNEQVSENRLQASCAFAEGVGVMPRWTCGDSSKIDEILDADGCGDMQFDMVFSCPPYADLEVYSDDPNDISNMPYDKFLTIYREIIRKSCAKLKDNRFAVFVVGEVRGKNGEYYNFVGDTVKAFQDAGLIYYNELMLVNQIGSTAIRVRKQFEDTRKIGKHHQNILVFAKGEPKEVNDMFEDLDIAKSVELFNKQREINDRHNKVLVFFKGDQKKINIDFEATTPPEPSWNDITILQQQ